MLWNVLVRFHVVMRTDGDWRLGKFSETARSEAGNGGAVGFFFFWMHRPCVPHIICLAAGY